MASNGHESNPKKTEIEVWHWPPGTIELLKYGHTGIKCRGNIYSFWPDTEGYKNGTAVVAPGYEGEDISRFAKKINPAFWGFYLGIVRKDTIYESATEFFKADNKNPEDIIKHQIPEGWILNGSAMPRVWVYKISVSDAVIETARKKLEKLRLSPPEYSAPKKLFCTPLVRDVLCESGLELVCGLDVKKPVPFAEGLEALAQNKSYQIEKQLRVLGIVNDGNEGPKFSWILSKEELT